MELALDYADAGAQWLHVVDLAASRDGAAADTSALFKLLGQAGNRYRPVAVCETGKDISHRLEAGASRVVIGSLSVTDSSGFIGWLDQYSAPTNWWLRWIFVSMRKEFHGRVFTAGPARVNRDMWQLLDELVAGGLEHLLCTDISRDGALSGPNLEFVLRNHRQVSRICNCRHPAVSAVSAICSNSNLQVRQV